MKKCNFCGKEITVGREGCANVYPYGLVKGREAYKPISFHFECLKMYLCQEQVNDDRGGGRR